MRTALMALVASCALLLSSCGKSCDLLGCHNTITVRVRDASGAALDAFKGTVTIEGETIDVRCPSTPARLDHECSPGAVSVSTPAMPYLLPATIDLSLTTEDGTKSFSGTATIVDRVMLREARDNGCYPGCEAGAVDVVLE